MRIKILNKNLILIIVFWLLMSINYINNVPFQHCSNDSFGHRIYTNIIKDEKRFPAPYEGEVTYHPPLYYLINSFFLSNFDEASHFKIGKFISVIYGAMAIVCIYVFLSEFSKNELIKALVILFISTTPRFFFTFNSYSNDGLITALCCGIFYFSYKLIYNPLKKHIFALFILSTLAMYTKYSVLWCMGSIVLFVLIKGIKEKKIKLFILFVSVFVTSFLSFLPWGIIHNYKETHKIFAFRRWDEPMLISGLNINSRLKTLKQILSFKDLNPDSPVWKYPYAGPANPSISKKSNFFLYSFITSVIGEYEYSSPEVVYVWALLFFHLSILVISLINFKSSLENIFSLSCILFSGLYQLLNITCLKSTALNIAFFMDYRFLLWVNIAWGLIYLKGCLRGNKFSSMLTLLLLVTVICQAYFISTAKGNWYGLN